MVQTAQKTYPKKGDVELYGLEQYPINKKVGTGTELDIGDILSRKDDLTPSYFGLYATGDKGPFYMARGRTLKVTAGWQVMDAGSYVAALETDATVSGVCEGTVVLDINGSIHPGRYAMPVNGGKKVAEWNGTNEYERCALFMGAPGQNTGQYVATVVTNGLGVFKWVGGVN
jgi:hypothetical protein